MVDKRSYLLLQQIGRGGFASVWAALDRERSKRVAIKVLHPDQAREPSRRERFFRGARVMAGLTHPAVVRVLNPHGEDGGYQYFVMELVEGEDLHHAVVGGRLPHDEAIPLILRVGEALAEAHVKGIVHRDVKPANILLNLSRAPKLTDFDLVNLKDTTGGTRTAGLGTFLYAAPEQMRRAKDSDARADVYGLGMTALFCLHGGELPETAFRHPEEVISGLPCSHAVRRVLTQAIEVKPDNRFADAHTLCEALREANKPRLAPRAPRSLPGAYIGFSSPPPPPQQAAVPSPAPVIEPGVMAAELQPPMPVLAGVAWSFQRPRYKGVPSFLRAVERFHMDAHRVLPSWEPEAVVLPRFTIRVRLGERGQVINLHAPGGDGFTAAGLLFMLHNALRPALEHEQDHYLRGVWLVDAGSALQPPLYEVRTAHWLDAETERPKGPLPKEVMQDVLWSFSEPRVKDRAAFAERVRQYEVEVDGEGDRHWDPDMLVLPAPVVCVNYTHRLATQEVDRMVVLRSARADGFTAADLLHQIHNDAAPRLAQHDHHFFEGLSLGSEPSPTKPPGYFILLGS